MWKPNMVKIINQHALFLQQPDQFSADTAQCHWKHAGEKNNMSLIQALINIAMWPGR